MPAKATKAQAVSTKAVEDVKYPEIVVGIRRISTGNPVTFPEAKELLGWLVETEDNKIGHNFHLVDEQGNRVLLSNNLSNRPFQDSWSETICQDHLNGNWRLNGETIIIGRTGKVLSGQHRLVALIMSVWVWHDKESPMYAQVRKVWKEEPVLECLIVYGIDEGSETTRTLDNVRPRKFSDVLFSDGKVFGKMTASNRKTLCSMTDHAIKMLWARTGAKDNGYAPYKTHTEAIKFLDRHPGILKAVKHIHDEESERSISKYVTLGYASAMLYMMATSGANDERVKTYREAELPTEKMVGLELWDKACKFWTLLAKKGRELQPLRDALKGLAEQGLQNDRNAKVGLIAKAWEMYREDEPLSIDKLTLETTTKDDGSVNVIEFPVFFGVDRGDPREVADHSEEANPSPEEIAAAAAEIRKKKIKPEDEPVEYEHTTNEEGDELIGIKPKPSKRKLKKAS